MAYPGDEDVRIAARRAVGDKAWAMSSNMREQGHVDLADEVKKIGDGLWAEAEKLFAERK